MRASRARLAHQPGPELGAGAGAQAGRVRHPGVLDDQAGPRAARLPSGAEAQWAVEHGMQPVELEDGHRGVREDRRGPGARDERPGWGRRRARRSCRRAGRRRRPRPPGGGRAARSGRGAWRPSRRAPAARRRAATARSGSAGRTRPGRRAHIGPARPRRRPGPRAGGWPASGSPPFAARRPRPPPGPRRPGRPGPTGRARIRRPVLAEREDRRHVAELPRRGARVDGRRLRHVDGVEAAQHLGQPGREGHDRCRGEEQDLSPSRSRDHHEQAGGQPREHERRDVLRPHRDHAARDPQPPPAPPAPRGERERGPEREHEPELGELEAAGVVREGGRRAAGCSRTPRAGRGTRGRSGRRRRARSTPRRARGGRRGSGAGGRGPRRRLREARARRGRAREEAR